MQSFFLAMVLHPEVQKKAQQSIDRVCHGRLPEFSDFHSLPYVHAVLKEVLRWHPVIPLSKQSLKVLVASASPNCCRSGARLNQGRRLQRLLYTQGLFRPRKYLVGAIHSSTRN